MKQDFKANIEEALYRGDLVAIVNMIEYEYEFDCPSFVYAGPGHQSKHTCQYKRPHDAEGEHYDDNTEWVGTSTLSQDGKLLENARHDNPQCRCSM